MDTKTHEVTRRRFTVHDYHLMGEAGILHEDDRVELIEGEIVEMAATGTRHFTCVNGLTSLLVRGVGDAAIISVQKPGEARRAHRTAARPRGASDQGLQGIAPCPEDVLLLIEVSDTTPTNATSSRALDMVLLQSHAVPHGK